MHWFQTTTKVALSLFKVGILKHGASDILGQIIHCWWGLSCVSWNCLFCCCCCYDLSHLSNWSNQNHFRHSQIPLGSKIVPGRFKEFYPPTWGWLDNSFHFFSSVLPWILFWSNKISWFSLLPCPLCMYPLSSLPYSNALSCLPPFSFLKFSYILSHNLSRLPF